ncbi:MAG: FAD-dependent oxidoreductase [Acetobacterium sp.]|nr:FAD-dependent oxidoreductase [Bacillota bacterium]MCG2730556.1 FAD-dependent oxidoreductase [Acetobacterium sp.]
MSNIKTAVAALKNTINQLKSANIELSHAFLALRLGDDAYLAALPVADTDKHDSHHFRVLNQAGLLSCHKLAYAIFLAHHKTNAVILTHSRFCSQAADEGQDIPAVLDDMAQIIGLTIRICAADDQKKINQLLKNCRGCLLKSPDASKQGAVAMGKNLAEAFIVTLLMEKAAQVYLQANLLGGAKILNPVESQIMHLGYELAYSKMSDKISHQTPADFPRPISADEMNRREQLVALGQVLARENLVQGTWGNISIRLDDQHMLCTPSGMDYATLTPYDMVRVAMTTLKYEGRIKPTGEKTLHAALYLNHPEVNCVIHTHPVHCSVFAAAHKKIEPPDSILRECLGGDVAVAQYAFPTSKQLSKNVVKAIKKNRACVMENHGMVVCGATPEDAYAKCLAAENSARFILEQISREQPVAAPKPAVSNKGVKPMRHFNKICRQIQTLSPRIIVTEERGCIVLRGAVDDWATAVKAGQLAVDQKNYLGVINDIRLTGFVQQRQTPAVQDHSLNSEKPDVLIIGGGIVGCAIARELSRYNLDILLVEKKSDVALGATGANGGVVHVGVNFSKKSQKYRYNLRGNRTYEALSKQMAVPFEQQGQVMLCVKKWECLLVWILKLKAKSMGIPGVTYLKREALLQHEPHLPDFVVGGMYMPTGGITNPFEMTIALAENAIQNKARISLDTIVTGMETRDGHITQVATNRGHLYPKLVINAAGVYADEIAELGGDRTFTIHPRRGTDIITDKNVGYMVRSSMGISPFAILPQQLSTLPKNPIKRMINGFTGKSHTKGVGLIHSIHGNMLIGPNAIETPDREDTATHYDEVNSILAMQQQIATALKPSDVIAYFTGVRAATYEEDFVVRKGIFTDNIIHAGGIQSPGVTAAPAIATEIAGWSVQMLSQAMNVTANPDFDPVRKPLPRLNSLDDSQRDALIRANPDYGIIVCRCEEISKGEIIDALNASLTVPTLDGIKRRLRPGMGRCQGGFCAPLVAGIIAEHFKIPLAAVTKSGENSVILYHQSKGVSL